MIAASRHTLIANVVQQFCAALIILYLPNILGKEDYAQIVYVSVLLSFWAFADAGISMAYSRVVPTLLAQNNHGEVELWNSTSLVFGLLASGAYSVIIALLYYARYGHVLNAILLLPVPFIVFWFSSHINRANATGDFRQYLRVNSRRAVGSLAVFPLAFMFGLTGWFIAQLVAALLALLSLGRHLAQPIGTPVWALVRKHLREGLLLSSTSVLWLQLLNFGRFYASLHYGAESIATYGIISAAYQSMSTLAISIFLPVSVGVQRSYGESEDNALAFANHSIARSLPIVMAATVLAIIAAPVAFRVCFPTYHFDSILLVTMLLSIVFYPFFMLYGALMTAHKRFAHFLTLVVSGIVLGYLLSMLVDMDYPGYGAAWGQLFGIMGYTLLLFFVIPRDAGEQAKRIWRSQARYLFGAVALNAGVIGVVVIVSRWHG